MCDCKCQALDIMHARWKRYAMDFIWLLGSPAVQCLQVNGMQSVRSSLELLL